MRTESILTGVYFLDHTADVGVEVVAPTLPELFARTAAGMMSLIRGSTPADQGDAAPAEHTLELDADDLPTLLRAWLRALLHRYEVEALALRSVRFEVLTATRLSAVLDLAPDTGPPIREIKGVTLHGLVAERKSGGWIGRVIFDV
ncbi:MAG: archease [Gemmatimonadetes bacterium]|nr:archease [Gemmatimonadota bacterium]